ncbi:MAG: hypothetical protein U1F58_00580 [Burkholderiales bacterium]
MTGLGAVGRGALALAFALALTGGALAQSAPSAASKPCDNARKKVAREQRALAENADAIAKARRARETCVSKSACARLDDAVADGERRHTRHATRLARFQDEVAQACR